MPVSASAAVSGVAAAAVPEEPALTAAQRDNRIAADVPYGLTVAAAWSWRVLLVLAMAGASFWLLSHVSLLVVPLIIAALLATSLGRLQRGLRGWGVPAGLSVAAIVISFLLVVVGLLTLVGQQLAVGFGDMRDQITVGLRGIVDWLASAGVTTDQWNEIVRDLGQAVRNNSQQILSGALGFGSTAGNIAAGTVLAIFALVFFLYDGERIWRFCLNFTPRRHRAAIDGAGRAGWRSLGSYVSVQVFVAFVDALGIGLGAWILGVPLALPLGVLVFFGSFVPLVGAFLTGAVAVLLALVANGWVNALIMLGIVLLVQQIEGNVLQPLVMGRAVSLHPLAVFLAVSGGTAVLGLVGAVFAVPLMAFLNATVRYFHARPWLEDAAPPEPAEAPESTLRQRAAELEGPWARAYVTIDGVVRKATGAAEADAQRRARRERRALKRSRSRLRSRTRLLPLRWGGRDDGGPVPPAPPAAPAPGETEASPSAPDGNVRAAGPPEEDNTGMDHSGRGPDQDGGPQ
ncbi:AI-2E family transporter [Citricoccus sp. SGAir0253]|nr:AI-2E family transporter [Citricoccus sp. SGAir0253]